MVGSVRPTEPRTLDTAPAGVREASGSDAPRAARDGARTALFGRAGRDLEAMGIAYFAADESPVTRGPLSSPDLDAQVLAPVVRVLGIRRRWVGGDAKPTASPPPAGERLPEGRCRVHSVDMGDLSRMGSERAGQGRSRPGLASRPRSRWQSPLCSFAAAARSSSAPCALLPRPRFSGRLREPRLHRGPR